MKILILDDDNFRHTEFTKRFKEYTDIESELFHVTTSIDAINLLKCIKFNMIFLDHDLGGKINVSSEEQNTGYEVSKYISENVDILDETYYIIIHSMNPVGAKRMEDQLKPIFFNTHRIPLLWKNNIFKKVFFKID